MPELPEVETVRRGLVPVLEDRRIAQAEARRDLRFPLPPRFSARLRGRRVTALDRRAKYLLAHLDDGTVWASHLGMSGRFIVNPPADAARGRASAGQDGAKAGWAFDPKHDHVVLTLDDGARVAFNDPRRFGYMFLTAGDALDAHERFRALGPEPIGPDFDAAALAPRLAGKRTPLKAALLDQRVVAGLGNIYVCESLHRARLSPLTLAGAIDRKAVGRLAKAIRDVIAEAIDAGGSSLRDYVRANGELGYFQHAFAVYGRDGAPCPRPRCGGTVERVVQSGRSTFHCPRCQPAAAG